MTVELIQILSQIMEEFIYPSICKEKILGLSDGNLTLPYLGIKNLNLECRSGSKNMLRKTMIQIPILSGRLQKLLQEGYFIHSFQKT